MADNGWQQVKSKNRRGGGRSRDFILPVVPGGGTAEMEIDNSEQSDDDYVLETFPKQEYQEFAMVHDNRLPPHDFFSKNVMLIIIKYSQNVKNFFKTFDFFSVKKIGETFKFEYSQTSYQPFVEIFKSLPPNFNSQKKIQNTSNLLSKYKIAPFKTRYGERWTMCVVGKTLLEIEPLEKVFKFNIYGKNLNRRGLPKHVLHFKNEFDLFKFWTDPASKIFSSIGINII